MSGSGCSAIGSTSFWISVALLLAGADGGGAGLAVDDVDVALVDGVALVVVWPRAAPVARSVASAKMEQAFIGTSYLHKQGHAELVWQNLCQDRLSKVTLS